MSSNILFNQSNIIDPSNSILEYKFPSSLKLEDGDSCAIKKINLFFSWFNVSKIYGNNQFKYLWWDANGDLTNLVTVTVDDGYYSIDLLNEYLIAAMTKNGHMLEAKDSSSNAYFLTMRANPVTYSIEIVTNSLCELYDDQSTANGNTTYLDYFKAPTGWKPPSTYQTPQMYINNAQFGKLIGFPVGTVVSESPTSGTLYAQQYSAGSKFTPQMEPSSNFIILCSLVNNDLSIPHDVIDSFCINNGSQFGDMLSYGDNVVYSKCKPGTYHSCTVSILDQSYNKVQILDPNILIILSILH